MAEKINKYEAIAPQILELVGGKDNIRSFAHCMTRLRFNVKDKGLVDADQDRQTARLHGHTVGPVISCRSSSVRQWIRPMMRSVQQVVCRRKQLWPKIWTAIRRKNSV